MFEDKHAKISLLAARFRKAIETCRKAKLPITFQHFPRGSCGDAALLLAKYLEENKIGQFNYMLGRRDDHSHAWLQNNTVIVDITGDQFPDMKHSIFVSTSSRWHEEFNGEILHVADFELYDPHTRHYLKSAYHLILDAINASKAEIDSL
ncbi:hypothetical protein ACX4MT_00015 [Roseomonas mucosa]